MKRAASAPAAYGSSRAWSNQVKRGSTPQRVRSSTLRSTTEVAEAVGIATVRPPSDSGSTRERKRMLRTGPRDPITSSGRMP